MSETQKASTKSKQPPSPAEAAAILASAVGYCQKAGVPINSAMDGSDLWLKFPGFEIVPLPSGNIEIQATGWGNGIGEVASGD